MLEKGRGGDKNDEPWHLILTSTLHSYGKKQHPEMYKLIDQYMTPDTYEFLHQKRNCFIAVFIYLNIWGQ